jgi:two-component sensor histidine kinase
LLKEIHHRVKNNLQVTSSLLRLQASKTSDPDARQVLRESRDRIRSMALVHEMLYRSQNLARIDFADYARSLVIQLFRSYDSARHVQRSVEVERVLLGVDLAVPCGLIINELVANALKHAFPDERPGRVWVQLDASDDRYQLRVRDDGVGFPDTVDFRSTDTLGLQLVRTLVDQMEGTIEIEREGGTEIVVVFPRRGGAH